MWWWISYLESLFGMDCVCRPIDTHRHWIWFTAPHTIWMGLLHIDRFQLSLCGCRFAFFISYSHRPTDHFGINVKSIFYFHTWSSDNFSSVSHLYWYYVEAPTRVECLGRTPGDKVLRGFFWENNESFRKEASPPNPPLTNQFAQVAKLIQFNEIQTQFPPTHSWKIHFSKTRTKFSLILALHRFPFIIIFGPAGMCCQCAVNVLSVSVLCKTYINIWICIRSVFNWCFSYVFVGGGIRYLPAINDEPNRRQWQRCWFRRRPMTMTTMMTKATW